ncbi:MAG: DUF1345 domain-containing protein [Rhodanobacter sp.]
MSSRSAKRKPSKSPAARPTSTTKKEGWWVFRYAKVLPRVTASLFCFVIVGIVSARLGLHLATALLLGFCVAAVLFLAALAYLFSQSTLATMRVRARALDTGRWVVLWSAVIVAGVVLVALGVELQLAKHGGVLELILGVASVVLSWLFLNSMFAIHYAHGYYGDLGKEHAGLEFPDTPDPDYWDFEYFAIVIGMTFQVSDVQITSRYLRRVVLLHSVIAFFFNVFIIAVTVNIVAGQG